MASEQKSRLDTFLAQDAEHEKACLEDKGRMKSDIQELFEKVNREDPDSFSRKDHDAYSLHIERLIERVEKRLDKAESYIDTHDDGAEDWKRRMIQVEESIKRLSK